MKIEIDVEKDWLDELKRIFMNKVIANKAGLAEYCLTDRIIAKVIDAMHMVEKKK